METKNKKTSPDRLYVTNQVKESIDRIDEIDFFGLGKNSISRSELFLFAMALGLEVNTPTELENINSGGFILEKSIDGKTKSVMYACYIKRNNLTSEQLDEISNKGEVYKLAEQYANTGFSLIEEYFENEKEKNLMMNMLIELDESIQKVL